MGKEQGYIPDYHDPTGENRWGKNREIFLMYQAMKRKSRGKEQGNFPIMIRQGKEQGKFPNSHNPTGENRWERAGKYSCHDPTGENRRGREQGNTSYAPGSESESLAEKSREIFK